MAWKKYNIFYYLLFFIFGGAIIGETLSLSIVVNHAGASILGKLYILNGLLLFLLPPLLLNKIDRTNRIQLLNITLISSTLLIILFLIFWKFVPTMVLYPFAYLTKTILFLSFWILVTDALHNRETKKLFPKISAWGFLGGIFGALISKLLLSSVTIEKAVVFWLLAYIPAILLLVPLSKYYAPQLREMEYIPRTSHGSSGVLANIRIVYKIELVRLISLFYFFVFISVFMIDFFFWNQANSLFPTSEKLANFQFSFYLIHGIFTLLLLFFVTPGLILKYGFIRVFSYLPFVFLFGSSVALFFKLFNISGYFFWLIVLSFQFLRYVTFENVFSPVYQMFFASISADMRGRSKTVVDGVVKPLSMVTAGLVVILVGSNGRMLFATLFIISLTMIFLVKKIKIAYLRRLKPNSSSEKEVDALIASIGSSSDQNILVILKRYLNSEESDLRTFAVRILAEIQTKQSLAILQDLYKNESEDIVKEKIALSIKKFYWYEARALVDEMLKEDNPIIVSNALSSVNKMNVFWKWRLKEKVKELLFSPVMRIKIEAAIFLWNTREKHEMETVRAFYTNLLADEDGFNRSAGIYIVSVIKPEGWEEILLFNISRNIKVFEKSVESILKNASYEVKEKCLRRVESFPREYITSLGNIIESLGRDVVGDIVRYLALTEKRRMFFELIHALRVIRYNTGYNIKKYNINDFTEKKLILWIKSEMERVYYMAFLWAKERHKEKNLLSSELMESAVKEQLFKASQWTLDAMGLLENSGNIAFGKKELDMSDASERLDMLEIIDSFGVSDLRSMVVPILEFDSWDEIAKKGKQLFNFRKGRDDFIEYFLSVETVWINMCAMYRIYEIGNKRAIMRLKSAIINLMGKDYPHVRECAEDLIEFWKSDKEKEELLNTFDLLETVLFLKRSLFFKNVPAERLMKLAEVSELVRYKKGDIVSKEGNNSDHMYVIKSGSLVITKIKDGIKVVLMIVKAGDAYGEIGLFSNSPRSASAVAHEDCELFVIQKSALKRLLMEIPEISYNFLIVFTEKLRKNGEELALLNTTLSNRNREKT